MLCIILCYMFYEWHLWCFQLLESLHFQGFVRKALAHLPPHNGGLVHQVIKCFWFRNSWNLNIATCFVRHHWQVFPVFLTELMMIVFIEVEPRSVDLLLLLRCLLLLIPQQLASRDEALRRLRQWRQFLHVWFLRLKWNRVVWINWHFLFGWILIYIRGMITGLLSRNRSLSSPSYPLGFQEQQLSNQEYERSMILRLGVLSTIQLRTNSTANGHRYCPLPACVASFSSSWQ